MTTSAAVKNKTILHVHHWIKNDEWKGMERLEQAVKAGKTGFWWFVEEWFEQTTHVCIWSEPETNDYGKLIVYKAPFTGYSTAVWGGKKYRILEFDASKAEWLDGPQETQRSWSFWPNGVYAETIKAN